jgi:DNA-binding transcriptional MerR regulator
MAQVRKKVERRRRSAPQKEVRGNNGSDDKYYYRLKDIADKLELKKHVLVHWENNFPEIAPIKINSIGLYTARDLEIFTQIKRMVRDEGFTIKGARSKLCEFLSSSNPLFYGGLPALGTDSEAELSDFPQSIEPESNPLEPDLIESSSGDSKPDLSSSQLQPTKSDSIQLTARLEQSKPAAVLQSAGLPAPAGSSVSSNSPEPLADKFTKGAGLSGSPPSPTKGLGAAAFSALSNLPPGILGLGAQGFPKTPASSPESEKDPWSLLDEIREELLALRAYLRKSPQKY